MPDVLTSVPALGAHPEPDGTWFRTWSPQTRAVAVVLYGPTGAETSRHPLEARGEGLFEAFLPGVGSGSRYKFALDGEAWPDPYARFMPEGVHGPAEVWAPQYTWRHPFPRVESARRVIYELHIGTFTPEGTYEAAAAKLPAIAELGVTTIELMPLSAFPGSRGWGYDGVAAFAPFAPYGRPEALMAFVDAAHGLGLEVFLDAVYNHFGPDGNYLWVYTPSYFTSAHKTPWGDALDYENPYMRQLVLDAASHWLSCYRFDGLRLDATHAIADMSPVHILAELAARASALEPPRPLHAEDDRNEPGLVSDLGLSGVWADDFHHVMHVLLTGEQDGYYRGYSPSVTDLATTIRAGWLYAGQVWPLSDKPRGKPAGDLPGSAFVTCIQNHDQIGNRALGDRLNHLIAPDAFLLATAVLLFAPATPLLFQGQEWGASTPFCFFSDHAGELGKAVSEGRAAEFGHFAAFATPEGRARIPDPQSEATFKASVLRWDERETGDHARMLEATRTLLRLRREHPAFAAPRAQTRTGAIGDWLWVQRGEGAHAALLWANFGGPSSLPVVPVPGFVADSTLFTSGPTVEDRLGRHAVMIVGGQTR